MGAMVVVAGAVVGIGSGPALASPAGEAAATSVLHQQWAQMSMQQKLGTCNAYPRNATVMTNAAVDLAMSTPKKRKDLSKSAWRRVYRAYFAWACSGAGRSPRPS